MADRLDDVAHGRRRHDVMTWLALGLVVALVLAWTTRSTPSDRASATAAGAAHGPSHQRIAATHGRERRDVPKADTARVTAPPEDPSATAAPRSATHIAAAPPPTVVTTTTTAPAVTTTTMPIRTTPTTAPAPSMLRTELPGTLSFPGDVALAFSTNGAGGALTVSGSWGSSYRLNLTLRCGAQYQSASGKGGATVRAPEVRGPCTVGVAEPAGATWRIPFTLVVSAASASTVP